jgi:hypothetical protein
MKTPAKTAPRVRKHLGLLVAVMAFPGAVLASPVFAQGHAGGGSHGFSGGHMSAPHFSAGHSVSAPHFAAAPHYAARPNFGGYNGGYHAPVGGYRAPMNYGHTYNVGQQVANNTTVHSNVAASRGYVAPNHGYVSPGRGPGFAPYRTAPGRFVPGSPFRYGHWNGGWWRGGFWPRVWWGANFPWFLTAIPAIAATYWWDSIPYYYYNDVYYTYDPSANGYVVTTPPPAEDQAGADASSGQPDPNANYTNPPPGNYPAPPAGGPAGGGLYAYPKNGQSDEQQSADRQECEQWANGQTGSNSSGNSPDYQRALTACLQGRGYSVN